MPIDYRLPALRRRRQAIAVRVANKQEILDAAQLDDRSATAYAMQINDAQFEFDELDFVISFFEHYAERPKIPHHITTFLAAFLLWAALTVMAWFVFVR